MAVAAHQLAGDDHDRPDDQIDDDLLGVADGPRRIEIAPDDLEQPDHQRDQTEQTDQGLLDLVPAAKNDRRFRPGHGSAAAAGFGHDQLDHFRRYLDVLGHLLLFGHHLLAF